MTYTDYNTPNKATPTPSLSHNTPPLLSTHFATRKTDWGALLRVHQTWAHSLFGPLHRIE